MAGDKMVYWHWFLESWPANAMSIKGSSITIKSGMILLNWDF